jgi:hypothetical protein
MRPRLEVRPSPSEAGADRPPVDQAGTVRVRCCQSSHATKLLVVARHMELFPEDRGARVVIMRAYHSDPEELPGRSDRRSGTAWRSGAREEMANMEPAERRLTWGRRELANVSERSPYSRGHFFGGIIVDYPELEAEALASLLRSVSPDQHDAARDGFIKGKESAARMRQRAGGPPSN